MSFELTIAEGRGRGQRFEFDAADITIGRGAENDIVLHDSGVSRTHARIRAQGPGYVLADNGSRSGTELNGEVIAIATPLRSGDRIGVGPIVFEFAARRLAAVPLPSGGGGGDGATRITAAPVRPDQETRVVALPGGAAARSVAPRLGGRLGEPAMELKDRFLALPLAVRAGALGAVALLIGLMVWGALSSRRASGPACPEVVGVDDDTASFTFGRGPVDVDCGGSVSFGFNAPAKTRVLFHYLPGRIAATNEVELKLNGRHVAWAPVAGGRSEPQALPLPDDLLGKDGRNVLQFTQAQRGKEWSIGRVRVELSAVTPGDLKAARTAYDLGRRKLEERNVAPRNLYDAWKYFVQARRLLEGLTPRPALYDEVAQLIKDAERDLDKECSRLFFTAARYEKYGQDEKAQLSYREVLQHFPGDDASGCRRRAQQNVVSTTTAARGPE